MGGIKAGIFDQISFRVDSLAGLRQMKAAAARIEKRRGTR
jgi:hypothetical protein